MMGEPVTDVQVRAHEIEPGKLVLHAGFEIEVAVGFGGGRHGLQSIARHAGGDGRR